MPTPGVIVPAVPTAKPERPFQIFAAGEYQGKEYTRQFLQEACENFERYQSVLDPVGMPKPPAVLLSQDDVKAAGVAVGHEDTRISVLDKAGADMLSAIARALLQKTDWPASGWVSKMWMVGDAVFVTLEGVPVNLAAACNAGLFRYCSAEWYDDYVGPSGTHYGPMLRRVAILGGDLPALKFLGRLPPFVFSERPELPGVRITCFSESLKMSHDELILALAKFLPNVAALVAGGMDDSALTLLLKAFQDGAPATGTPVDGSTLPGVVCAEPLPGNCTPGQIAAMSEDVTSGSAAKVLTGTEGVPKLGPNDLSPAFFSEIRTLTNGLRSLSVQMSQQVAASKVHLEAVAKQKRELERNEVTAFCERLVRERKIPPHELSSVDGTGKRKPSRMEILLALDNQNKVFVFGENQLTPRELAMRELDSLAPRTFSEKLPAAPQTDAEMREARRVELLSKSDGGQGVLMREAKAKGLTRTADGRIVV